jgi:hypothetical protein
MSWKAPPLIEISSTPPSKVLSRSRFWRKVSTGAVGGAAIVGESRRLSLTLAGSSTKAAFGAESAAGVGLPELEVVHRPVPEALVAVQPAGSAGAVTPSKFSLETMLTTAIEAEAESEPSLLVEKEAVLFSVAPQVALIVPLTTCTWVLEPAPRDVGL